MESAELKILYEEVLHFLISELSLPIPQDMFDVPILAVDLYSLNEHYMKERQEGLFDMSGHFTPTSGAGNGNTLTVGLTMSTIGTVRYFQPKEVAKRMGFTQFFGSNSHADEDLSEFFTVSRKSEAKVTGILVLFGLPHDYAASILAHEAFHAYMRLSPSFQTTVSNSSARTDAPSSMPQYALPSYLQSTTQSNTRRAAGNSAKTGYPPIVEEGLCQVIAYKYLEFLSRRCTSVGISESTDVGERNRAERFREYCRYRIREDTNEVYGEGYRRASVLTETITLPILLDYVATNHDFPLV
jgi:hypothetical protein